MKREALRATSWVALAAWVAVYLLASCNAPASQAPSPSAPTLWLTETPAMTPTLKATATPWPGPTSTHPVVTLTPLAETATGGQEPATPLPPLDLGDEDTAPPRPEATPAAPGIAVTVGKPLTVYPRQYEEQPNAVVPAGSEVTVLYYQRTFSNGDWYVVEYTGTDGRNYKAFVPVNSIGRLSGVKNLPRDQLSSIPKETELRPLPTPASPDFVYTDPESGKRIDFLGQWNPKDVNAFKERLSWIKTNEPALYKHLIEYRAITGADNPDVYFSGKCDGIVCTAPARDGGAGLAIPNVYDLLHHWGNPDKDINDSTATLWHEAARKMALDNSSPYQNFKGLDGSPSNKNDQFAVALAVAYLLQKGEIYDPSEHGNPIKAQLDFAKVPEKNRANLSYLLSDPGIQASGVLGE